MTYVTFERYFDAERVFERIVGQDDTYLPAVVNLGNTAYLRGRFEDALDMYRRAEEILTEKGRTDSPTFSKVLVNISQAYHRLEKYNEAKDYFAKAESIDPESAAGFAYLGASDSGGRASDVAASDTIIMLDSEEEE
jgi:tetratricopeptide (TPR) repeat protein